MSIESAVGLLGIQRLLETSIISGVNLTPFGTSR